MLQATFTISAADLTADFLEKIKALFKGDGKNLEITISVKPKETQEASRLRIDRSIEQIEKGNHLVAF